MSALTVLILIPNAGDRLCRCLESVSWAEDVFCVVDPNTNDGSQELVKRFTEHVVAHPYENKAAQCNWAIPQIESEWTLVLDADEWVSPELARVIAQTIAQSGGANGYRIKRESYFFGKLIRHCGWDHDYNVRLFRTRKGQYHARRVHASIEIEGDLGRIDAVMYHDDKRNFEEYFATFQRFTSWSAQDLFEQGKRAGLINLTLRPLSRFIKMYVLRLGFLDGYHGAVLCGLAAFSVFVKYAKLWNLQRLADGGSEKPPAA